MTQHFLNLRCLAIDVLLLLQVRPEINNVCSKRQFGRDALK